MAFIKHLESVVLMLAVTFGVVGNIHVIVSIYRKRSLLKNNHYYLVFHLAVCDLFYLLLFTPTIYSNFTANQPLSSYSNVFCKISSPVHTLFLIAGVYFMVLISVIRYYAILHPLKPAVNRRTLKILSTFIYIFATVCCIPILLVLKFDRYKNQNCDEDWPTESLNIVYTVFLASIQYFIPVFFLFAIYIKICKKLVTQNRKINITNGRNMTSEAEREKAPSTWFQAVKLGNTKSFVVCFTIVICFMISGFPIQVAWIVYVAGSHGSLPTYYFWFEALYLFGTCAINPFVYGALDKKVFCAFKHCQRKTIGLY